MMTTTEIALETSEVRTCPHRTDERAIGIDNVGHGERRLPGFERRIGSLGPGPELEAQFLALVHETAREVPRVR